MIRLSQVKVPLQHRDDDIRKKCAKLLRIAPADIEAMRIVKKSIDARKKQEISYVYTVDVKVKQNETKVIAHTKGQSATIAVDHPYRFPEKGSEPLAKRPVVIGLGPAGLFAAYALARHGYSPLVFERGQCVEVRTKDVLRFWESGVLDPGSNVQFGEGGAGTFSDGKLNTLIKDKDGRGRHVLSIFVENGAQPEILYDAKPHIGTDVLSNVVKQMREKIIQLGGEVRFESRVETFRTENGALTGVILSDGSVIDTETAVLAIGHSARDTFFKLYESGLHMEAKAFAVGLRVEHPQELINQSQYGTLHPDSLGAAPYKVTARTSGGRGVYSFCMCPGGYVVNASSEPGRIAVNGMSYSGRNGANANSAIIVSVTPADYGSDEPLAGIEFQRRLEEKAFSAGSGKIPVERYGDFSDTATTGHIPTEFVPAIKGQWTFADVKSVLPDSLSEAFIEGMEQFGHRIPGFDDANAVVSGIESRTSSPVRIVRDDTLQANIRGIYPCGEGAGYAGGITSAAMDGVRVAEAIASCYAPFSETGK